MANIHWNWTPQSVAAYLAGLMNINNVDLNNDSHIVVHLKGPFGLPGQELMLPTSIVKVDENPTIPYHSLTVGVGNVELPHVKNFALSNNSTTLDLDRIYQVIGVMSNIIIPNGELVKVTNERSNWILTDFIIRTLLNSGGAFAVYNKPWGNEHYEPTQRQLQASVNRGLYVEELILQFPINSNDPIGGGVWLKLRTNNIINFLLDKQVDPADLLPHVWFYADFTTLTLAHMNLIYQSGVAVPVNSIIQRTTYDLHFKNIQTYESYYRQAPILVPTSQQTTIMANPAPQSPFIHNNIMMTNNGSSWMTQAPMSFNSAVPIVQRLV